MALTALLVMFALVSQPSAAAAAPAPAPIATVTVSSNVTGSLGSLCSSQSGVLQLTQGAAAGRNTSGINVTIPASLNNAAAVQEIAQVRDYLRAKQLTLKSRAQQRFTKAQVNRVNVLPFVRVFLRRITELLPWFCPQIAWEYIYSYPLPIVAKTLAGGSANGTGANSFYAHVNHLSTPDDNGVVAPNHDTVYGSAFLDLSQVRGCWSAPGFRQQ